MFYVWSLLCFNIYVWGGIGSPWCTGKSSGHWITRLWLWGGHLTSLGNGFLSYKMKVSEGLSGQVRRIRVSYISGSAVTELWAENLMMVLQSDSILCLDQFCLIPSALTWEGVASVCSLCFTFILGMADCSSCRRKRRRNKELQNCSTLTHARCQSEIHGKRKHIQAKETDCGNI